MKRSLRFVVLSLTIGLAFSNLTGCGKAENKSTDSNVKATTEADAKPGSQALPIVTTPTTLKIWHPVTTDITQSVKTLDNSEYYKELEKRTGIHFEFIHPVMGQEQQSLNLLVSSGELPDIVVTYVGQYSFQGGYDKAIEDGTIIKVNDLAKKYAPNFLAALNEDADMKKSAYTDSGNLPQFWSVTSPGQKPFMGVTIRQDWLDDLGLKTPVTYDDWEKVLTAFKEKKGAVAPMMLYNTGFSSMENFSSGFNFGFSTGAFYQQAGKVKYGPLEPGFKEYVTMMNKWYKAGLIDKDFATKKDRTPSNTFISTGKAGAWEDLGSRYVSDKQQATDPNYKIVGVPNPVKTVGDKNTYKMDLGRLGSSGWSVTSKCKNPDVVAKLINYIYSADGQKLSNYGLEGKTYTLGTDGKVKYTDELLKNPNGLTLNQALAKYTQTTGAQYYMHDKQYPGIDAAGLAAYDVWSKIPAGASTNLPQALSLTPDEASQFNKINSDLDTYAKEMALKFIMGVEPLSNFDAFVSKVKTMKVDDAIKIQQTALDRFNARK